MKKNEQRDAWARMEKSLLIQAVLACKIILIFLIGASIARAEGYVETESDQPLWAPFSVVNAFSAEVNQSGIDMVSREIQRIALQNIVDRPISDFSDEISGGIHVDAEGLKISVAFQDVKLQTMANGLELSVQLKKLKLTAEKMRFYKKIGFTVSTTCEDTTMTIGESGQIIEISASLFPTINSNHDLEMRADGIDFPIPEDEFGVEGPRKCSGALGVGYLVKLSIKKILVKARSKIQQALVEQITSKLPSIAQKLNAPLHFSQQVSLRILPSLPPTVATVKASPSKISVEENRMRLVMNLDFTPANPSPLLEVGSDMRRAAIAQQKSESFDLKEILGAASVSTTLMNQIISVITPKQAEFYEIDLESAGRLHDILNRHSLATIWPDLNLIHLDDNNIRLFLSLPSPPTIATTRDVNTPEIAFKTADLVLSVYVKKDGTWQPYSYLHANAAVPIEFVVGEEDITIAPKPATELSTSSEWAEGYTPQVDIFEQDLADSIFASAIEILAERQPMLLGKKPVFAIGAERVSVGNFGIGESSVNIQIMSQQLFF